MSVYSTYSQLVKPNKVDISVDGNVGKFVIYPIQRGYGVTLGNSLRRIMLSSLRGSVVSAVKIDGVDHEFSTIPSVREDVTQICLNMRKVVVKSEEDNSEAFLEIQGPCVVTAGMIQTKKNVEIVNKDLYLFEIESNASVKMKLTISSGIGCFFVENKTEDQEIGQIFLDCYFSPVKKVSFSTDTTRVDKFTDYDKLTMVIETNGSISPDEVINMSSGILRDFLRALTNLEEGALADFSSFGEKSKENEYNYNLLRRTENVELSVRSANCLTGAGIKYMGDLVQKTENEMLKMPNFGRKSLDELREVLTKMNLSFGMSIGTWPPKDFTKLLAAAEKRFEDE